MKVSIYETKERIIDVPEGMPYITVDMYDTHGLMSEASQRKQLPIETLCYNTTHLVERCQLEEDGWLCKDEYYDTSGKYTYLFHKKAAFDESTRKAFQFLEEKYKSEVESVKIQLDLADRDVFQAKLKASIAENQWNACKGAIAKINNMPYLKRIWHFLKGGKV